MTQPLKDEIEWRIADIACIPGLSLNAVLRLQKIIRENISHDTSKHYIYEYYDLDGYVIYVGKGSGLRAWHHQAASLGRSSEAAGYQNPNFMEALRRILARGAMPVPNIVARYETPAEALMDEHLRIQLYKDHPDTEQRRRLTNWIGVRSRAPLVITGWCGVAFGPSKLIHFPLKARVEDLPLRQAPCRDRQRRRDEAWALVQRLVRCLQPRTGIIEYSKSARDCAYELRKVIGYNSFLIVSDRDGNHDLRVFPNNAAPDAIHAAMELWSAPSEDAGFFEPLSAAASKVVGRVKPTVQPPKKPSKRRKPKHGPEQLMVVTSESDRAAGLS